MHERQSALCHPLLLLLPCLSVLTLKHVSRKCDIKQIYNICGYRMSCYLHDIVVDKVCILQSKLVS